MKNVIFLSTMWEKVNPEMGNRREDELRQKFWKPMIDKGSRMDRLERATFEDAWRVLEQLITEHEQREVILLQQEVVDLGKRLDETQAGKNLYNPFQKLLHEQKTVLNGLIEQIKNPSNEEVKKRLQEEAARIEEQFRRTFEEMKKLKVSFGRRILLYFLGTRKREGVA